MVKEGDAADDKTPPVTNTRVTIKQLPKVAMESYDPKISHWNVYQERMENFFACMQVTKPPEKNIYVVELHRSRTVRSRTRHVLTAITFVRRVADLTLKKAIQLAVKYDKVKPAANETVDFVSHNTKNRSSKPRKKTDEKSNGRNNEKERSARCRHCGYKNHTDEQCRYKSAKCRRCDHTGHLASVCKQKKENVNLLNQSDLIDSVSDNLLEQLFNIESSDSTQPIFACVAIDSCTHRFIVDSGSSVSLINKAMFGEKFSSHTIKTQEQ